ncbi:MAG: WbqC family protein [Bacteroidales bacterium]|nr:WbqC family protein [Bacteroidales bacterium]
MNQEPVLLSIAYLPPVSYFTLLLQQPSVIEKQETFPKQTYRNRCRIYSDKGIMSLSIPVTKPLGNHTPTDQVLILNEDKWYLRHWRALLAAYESSPYFLYYKDDLEPYFQGMEVNLFQFDLNLIHKVCELIGFEPDIQFTEQYEKAPSGITDLRQTIHPKQENLLGNFPSYFQVFDDKHGFIPDLSIVDLLFNLGPETKSYLSQLKTSF